jgi:hypothetical protein
MPARRACQFKCTLNRDLTVAATSSRPFGPLIRYREFIGLFKWYGTLVTITLDLNSNAPFSINEL